MDGIAKLNALELKLVTDKYPSNPYPVATVHKDNSANSLTKAIVRWIELHNGQAERINTQGTFIKGKTIGVGMYGIKQLQGKYIPSGSTRGSADISATINGRSVKIEVKQKDKQSPAQVAYQQAIEKAGGLYWLVRTFDEFIEKWEGLQ
jgi:hypothetical protein